MQKAAGRVDRKVKAINSVSGRMVIKHDASDGYTCYLCIVAANRVGLLLRGPAARILFCLDVFRAHGREVLLHGFHQYDRRAA